MAEELIKTREVAASQIHNSIHQIEAISKSENCPNVSEIYSKEHAKNAAHTSEKVSSGSLTENECDSVTAYRSAGSSIINMHENKKETSFDDPSWLEGLLQGDMEKNISIENQQNKSIIASGSSSSRKFLYCYITDRGKESNDQNEAEVDIEESVSYLVACLKGIENVFAHIILYKTLV